MIRLTPPPPPLHPPPPPLFVVEVNIANVVKCFVQTTRSAPELILQSPSTERASPII